jgi:hypothetical protein
MGRQASLLLWLGVFLTSLVWPRFGLLWHEHADREKAHAYHEILQMLASHAAGAQHSGHQHAHQAPHEHDAPHASYEQHAAGLQVVFSAAPTSNLHGHYFDDTLLVYCGFLQTLCGAVFRIFLRLDRSVSHVSRQLLPTAARAPPCGRR